MNYINNTTFRMYFFLFVVFSAVWKLNNIIVLLNQELLFNPVGHELMYLS